MSKSKPSSKVKSNLKLISRDSRVEQESRDVRTFKTLEVYQDAQAIALELVKLQGAKFRSPQLRSVLEQLMWRLPNGIASAYGARYHDRASCV